MLHPDERTHDLLDGTRGGRRTNRTLSRWQARAASELGILPHDWLDPLCAPLVGALRRGEADLVAAVHRFVRRRARDGWGLRVIVGDLEHLRRSLPLRRRWSRRWRSIRVEAAAAYADEVIDALLFTSARDPLSGLPNHSYLAVHLEELVAATDPDDGCRAQLVMVQAQRCSPSVTDRMATKILLGQALRDTVVPGVLVAHVTDESFVLVLPPLLSVSVVRGDIDAALRQLTAVESVVVTTTALPRTRADLASLLGTWWRQRALDHPPGPRPTHR